MSHLDTLWNILPLNNTGAESASKGITLNVVLVILLFINYDRKWNQNSPSSVSVTDFFLEDLTNRGLSDGHFTRCIGDC